MVLLSTETSVVLQNGVPGNSFKCRRGVRQGDLLSPFLFVLAADFLHTILNNAMQRGVIKPPIHSCPDFPILEYTDDTSEIVQACQEVTTTSAVDESFLSSLQNQC